MLVGQTIGPFAIDKELGTGAMGAVYRAKHTQSGKWVAIKLMAPGLATNEVALERFKRESDILKQLKHPNIVRLYATGRFGSTMFYAMEYIEGESLDKVMARRGRISWEEVVEFGTQLCAALKHAHDHGIVHRDLKPSNLMLLKDGTLKLTDFGIAKDLDRTALTEANCTVGTAAYMSPEQCRGERTLTLKSDLYSMGVMFYELLTGKKPFEADSPMDMFLQHVKGKFERPSRVVLELPVFLDTLVCQLMEKDPERRPFDAAMVADALGRVQEKMLAQQAAGLDAAKTRNRDRPPDAARVNATDREAARALLGKKKKKTAQERAPFYRRRWFQAAGLSGLLVAIVAVLFVVLFKKPSPESLYENARELMATGDADQQQQARKDPIQRYLTYYSDRDDEMTRKVRGWADKVDADKLRHQLRNRQRRDLATEDDNEKTFRLAMDATKGGKYKQAREAWEMLARFKDEPLNPDPELSEKRSYGLIGKEHLEVFDAVDRLEARLKDMEPKDVQKLTDAHEKKAQAALQDPAKAQPTWREFQNPPYEWDNPATRVWWLLAAKRLELPPPK